MPRSRSLPRALRPTSARFRRPAEAGTSMATASGGDMTRDEATPRRVLLATDTSSTSGSAEKAAIELAARVGASLIVLSVIDPSRLRLPGGLFHTRVDQVRAQRESAVTGIVEEARRRGVSAHFLVWGG